MDGIARGFATYLRLRHTQAARREDLANRVAAS
jgi:hypothetical protein